MSIINNLIQNGKEINPFTTILITFLTSVLQVIYIIFDNSIPQYFNDYHFFARSSTNNPVQIQQQSRRALVLKDISHLQSRKKSQNAYKLLYKVANKIINQVIDININYQIDSKIKVSGELYILKNPDDVYIYQNQSELTEYLQNLIRQGKYKISNQKTSINQKEITKKYSDYSIERINILNVNKDIYNYNNSTNFCFNSKYKSTPLKMKEVIVRSNQRFLPKELFMKEGQAYLYRNSNGQVGIFVCKEKIIQNNTKEGSKVSPLDNFVDTLTSNFINEENSKLFS